jgi:hypothetical protein
MCSDPENCLYNGHLIQDTPVALAPQCSQRCPFCRLFDENMKNKVRTIYSMNLQRLWAATYLKITFRFSVLKMKAIGSYEIFAHIYQATRYHITEGRDFYSNRRDTCFAGQLSLHHVIIWRIVREVCSISNPSAGYTILILGVCILLRVWDQGESVFRLRNGSVVDRVNPVENMCLKMVLGPKHVAQ